MFLSDEELYRLTGRKNKSKQIEWLRAQGVPFRISATGHPVVTRVAIEGGKETAMADQGWTPGLSGA